MRKQSINITKICIYFAIVVTSAFLYLTFLYYRHYKSLFEHYPQQQYIAHAGGAIDGYTYTNSLEAVENAINNNITYIELDLALTSDSFIVAAHDWESFAEMAGIHLNDKTAPTLDIVKNCKLYGKYTPLTFSMIDSLFFSNPGLTLVTDKLDDTEIMSRQLPRLSGRVLVECFSGDSFKQTAENGWGFPMASYFSIATLNVANINGLRYTMTKVLPMTFALYKLNGVTRHEADSIFNSDKRVRFVYVDFVE